MNIKIFKGANSAFFIVSFLLLSYSVYIIGHCTTIANNGWDGTKYTKMAQDFNANVIQNKESAYYVQRIFPSLVVSLGLKFQKTAPTFQDVAFGFHVFNLFLIIVSMFLLKLISDRLKFTTRVYVMGVIMLFFSFGVLTETLYYPTLTDTSAMFFGVLLLYGYVFNNVWIMSLATVLGAFTWPFFMFFGLPCILFPFQKEIQLHQKESDLIDKLLPFILGLPLAFMSSRVVLAYVQDRTMYLPGNVPKELYDFYWLPKLAPLCVFLNYFMFVWMVKVLCPKWTKLKEFFVSFWSFEGRVVHYVMATVCFVVVFLVKIQFTNPDAYSPNGFGGLLHDAVSVATIKPFVVLVEAFNNHGILIVFFVLFFRSITAFVSKLGGGFYVGFVFLILISLVPESRRYINYIPFLVLLTMFYLNEKGVSIGVLLVTILVNAIQIKSFMHFAAINFADMWHWFEYPIQYYFMNTYLISNEAYLHSLLFFVLVGIALFFLFWTKNKKVIIAREVV